MRPVAKPESCTGCPAEHIGIGFVPPEGPLDAKLCVVATGPDEMDARFSRPYFPNTPAGKSMDHWITKAEWQRSWTLMTSLIWCWLPKSTKNGIGQSARDPKVSEVQFCTERHLLPLLSKAGLLEPNPNRVIAAEPLAAAFLLETTDVNKRIGTFEQRDLRGLRVAEGREEGHGPSPAVEYTGDGSGGVPS